MVRNEPRCISCLASRFMRLDVDSSESMRLPLRWSFDRLRSSADTPFFLRSRISLSVDFSTLEKLPASVAA